ncbi:MAG: hypothetical protein H6685_13275 [Deltaproteobacteria bacterium]|nr:hypothetical protein [Deltaproteobacteria bacterium]
MSNGRPPIGPWSLAALLLVMILVQATLLAHREPAGNDATAGAPMILPIRPPLTRPDPGEALVMSPDHDDDSAPVDTHDAAALGKRADELRYALTRDAFEMARVLTMPQMLHAFGNRDRLTKTEYEGRLYRELESALSDLAAREVAP